MWIGKAISEISSLQYNSPQHFCMYGFSPTEGVQEVSPSMWISGLAGASDLALMKIHVPDNIQNFTLDFLDLSLW